MKSFLAVLALLASFASAQTTTSITGTIKDLSGALVTSGKVTFTLEPSTDTTISGLARFSPAQVVCLINSSGQIVSLAAGTCTVTMNTALNPPGSYYRVDVWPYNVKTSVFTFYAVLSSYDWSTVVPTPSTSPAQNFVDIFSNQTIGGNKTFTGPTAFEGTITQGNLNGDILLDGTVYPTLAAALAAVPSGGTVRIAAGTYAISSQIAPVSSIDIECSPNNLTVLQASSSFSNSNGLFYANGISYFKMHGCVVDGNKGSNSNQFPLISLNGCSHCEIGSNHLQNNQTRALSIYGSTDIRVIHNEIDHYGQAGATINNEGVEIAGTSSTGNAHIYVADNFIHDGDIGIGVYPANPTTTAPTLDVDISHNRILAEAQTGILLYSTSAAGSTMSGRIVNNEADCTGTSSGPGTWNSTACPVGYLQGTGTTLDGVGINLNSALMDRWEISGNQTYYNWREGLDNTSYIAPKVNTQNASSGGCSADCVIWSSGDTFYTGWKSGTPILINGTLQFVSSVQSSTLLTIQGAPGTLTGVSTQMPVSSRTTLVGNISCFNGNGNTSYTIGHGFADVSLNSSYSNNRACNNRATGFISTSFGVSHTGDYAIANSQGSAGSTSGFYDLGGYDTYTNVLTDDLSTTTQSVPMTTGGQNATVAGSFLCVYANCTTLDNDQGTGTSIIYRAPLGTLSLTGQTANVAATTLFTTGTAGFYGPGLYQVCISMWPTSTGNSANLNGNVVAPSGAGTVTQTIGSQLSTAALTNGGGGCATVSVAASSAIQVSTSNYNTTGTYSIKAYVKRVPSL